MPLQRRHLAVVFSVTVVGAALILGFERGVPEVDSTPGASGNAELQRRATPTAPSVVIEPAPGAVGVAPLGMVRVTATSGALVEVRLVNEQGRSVTGSLGVDQRVWEPSGPLGYGRTYTLTASGSGSDSTIVSEKSRFSTVVPQHQTAVTLATTSGAALADGGTYGVGTVIVARFDDPIPDRAAAERSLRVIAQPAVQGSWYWVNDQQANWRPREYFPAGTKVNVEANVYGVDLGDGLYGQQDARVGFTIGPSHVTVVDDTTKQANVYIDGVLARTMPTSMGRGGNQTVNGKTINFWTQPGVYTVLDKANPVLMDSSTYGLPVDSPAGYRISVPYATRISPDGIYLHEREATVWAQGNTNVSAGCLNLSAANAQWFYELSQPGDVVDIRNTDGAPLQQWQNGDWSVSWADWIKGSALKTPGQPDQAPGPPR